MKELEQRGCQWRREWQGATARRIFLFCRGRRREEQPAPRAGHSLGGIQQPARHAADPHEVAHLHDRVCAGGPASPEIHREEGDFVGPSL